MNRRVVVVLIALAACSAPAAITSTSSSTSLPATTSSPATSTTTATLTHDHHRHDHHSRTDVGAAIHRELGRADRLFRRTVTGFRSDLDSPVEGGEIYQVIDLDGEVGESVGNEITVCEPAGTPLVELDPPLLVTSEEPSEIAVAGANWNLTPRPVESRGVASGGSDCRGRRLHRGPRPCRPEPQRGPIPDL